MERDLRLSDPGDPSTLGFSVGLSLLGAESSSPLLVEMAEIDEEAWEER